MKKMSVPKSLDWAVVGNFYHESNFPFLGKILRILDKAVISILVIVVVELPFLIIVLQKYQLILLSF